MAGQMLTAGEQLVAGWGLSGPVPCLARASSAMRLLVALVSALRLARGLALPPPKQAAMAQAAAPGAAIAAAATPPMGWNRHNAYGAMITEAKFRGTPCG
jgi:hypothetical protein